MSIDLIILLIVPIIGFAIYIYIKNKYNNQPLKVLLKSFVLGIFTGIFAIILESLLVKVSLFTGSTQNIYISFIVASLVEEGTKLAIIFPLIIRSKMFDDKLDGIMYMIFLGLGFAGIENLVYIVYENIDTVHQVMLLRSIISVPAHIMFAIIMGYYISKYKFSSKSKKIENIILALIVPVLLHGIYDFILMMSNRWAMIIFVIYMTILMKFSLDIFDKYIKKSKKDFYKGKQDRRN